MGVSHGVHIDDLVSDSTRGTEHDCRGLSPLGRWFAVEGYSTGDLTVANNADVEL